MVTKFVADHVLRQHTHIYILTNFTLIILFTTITELASTGVYAACELRPSGTYEGPCFFGINDFDCTFECENELKEHSTNLKATA
jgi:hypothetical protein